ncbi:hypothetical protein R5H30_07345 [Sulfitobacter sp. D35]|uniref:hypothetical protein n=1 Tax=Sulfitobacter sp. D35 TaxID=3083252 RepID=UPI00296E49BF|nr:hypothetical protein [Sulfitobacter sp. D35]MDW4497790.1 hypothetical protein [Sulfitobacter sp. D35]
MRPVFVVAVPALVALLTACAPLTTYYREGVEVSRLATDQTNCEIKALQQVPPSNQIRREAPYYVPGRRSCNDRGDCRVYGGYWIPGDVYTVDVNRGLRERAETLCMAEQGYSRVTLPDCAPGVAQSVAPASTTRLPPLRQGSCAIRRGGGRWQIVTPGA